MKKPARAGVAEFNVAVGARITAARQKSGMTQKDLSRKAAVSIAKVSRWEWGLTPLTLYDAARVCKILGRSVESFMEGLT